MHLTKAIFAAALCAGLAACGTTNTATDSSGASYNSSTGSSSPAVWSEDGKSSSTATPGTAPDAPSNAADNSVRR